MSSGFFVFRYFWFFEILVVILLNKSRVAPLIVKADLKHPPIGGIQGAKVFLYCLVTQLVRVLF